MSICMVGIDHHRADLDLRSRFSFTKKRIGDAYAYIRQNPQVTGCVLLSTCNRFELWLNLTEDSSLSPVRLICSYLGEDPDAVDPYFITRKNDMAVDHLFRVAAGMESRIVGEDQIITQVNEAAAFARSCAATDHTLEVLFRTAVTAGKRIKTELELSARDPSVIHTSLRVLEEQGVSFSGKRCMVIGSGLMGKAAAEALLERGAEVSVTVRKYRGSTVDIPRECRRIEYDDRLSFLPSCDLVVSATKCPGYTLRREKLAPMSVDHPVYMLDLAVPRDIEKTIGGLDWVRLYDIDSFRIDPQSDTLAENLRKGQTILDEEKQRFYHWYNCRDFVPRMQRLKDMASSDVTARMTPFFKNAAMGGVEKAALEREIEGASARMLNNLLFGIQNKLPDSLFEACLTAMEQSLAERLREE